MKDIVIFKSTKDTETQNEEASERSCKYTIYKSIPENGLVVYIPGFGEDLGTYRDNFCMSICKEHRISAMTVDYHCIGSRPISGAQIYFEESDIEEIRKEIPDFNEKDWNKELEQYAKQTKKELIFSAGISPTNNEYQNFGILAAIDIINAINDALQRYRIDKNNITLIGSSYGGYLANLVTKIKPGAIRLVLDNSSWAKPNLSYIVGREINSPEFTYSINNKIKLQLYVKTPWTLKDSGNNRFTGAVKEIRSFTIDQVKQMANQGATNTEYIFYHSIKDTFIAPVSEKKQMINDMESQGFMKINFKIFNISDIGRKKIKSLDHGMRLSMKNFFKEHLKENNDFRCSTITESTYTAVDHIYKFKNLNSLIELDIAKNQKEK